MPAAPFVSICVPTYNGERYLRSCLDAAISQTFSNIEILIVDDASKDSTVDIATAYAMRDPRVHVHRNNENLGLVGNWNRCLELARGRWIKFLFQDDLLDPACIDALLKAASERNREFVFCYRDFIFEDGTPDATRRYLEGQRNLVSKWFEHGELPPNDLIHLAIREDPRNLIGEPTVVMLTKDLFQRTGPFNKHLIHLCDAEYWVRAGSRSGIACCQSILATFRVHPSSTTTANDRFRGYRKATLDPLVIMHDWLFAAEYEPLRSQAAAIGALGSIQAKFWDGCHDAKRIASDRLAQGDVTAWETWNELLESFPRMRHIPPTQRLFRKLRRAKSALDSR